MTRFACTAVLFDCDGVLVDSDASVIAAWTRWAVHHGLVPDEVLGVVHGRRSADTVAALVAAADRPDALARIDRYEIEDAAAVHAIPGARELTASMPAPTWAVVTSGTAALAQARLRVAGITGAQVLITADDVARGKPDPEGYLEAAQRLGVPPEKCIVLEDAAAGIAAARAAGVSAVIGVGGRGLSELADAVVADLTALRWDGTGLVVGTSR